MSPPPPSPRPETASTADGRVVEGVIPAALSSPAYLLLFEGDSTRMVPLPAEGDFTLGRDDGNDLKLLDHRVSRVHARFSSSGGQWFLTDLGSQNGTLVNDELVPGRRILSSGDVVTIGSAVLVFQTSKRAGGRPDVLERGTFRARAELELERASRFHRPLAVADFFFEGAADRPQVWAALEGTLRRIDLACWAAPDRLSVFFPEAGKEAAQSLAEQVLEALAPMNVSVRAGLATYPEDGADSDTLLAAARSASSGATVGELALAAATVCTLVLGDKAVLIADPAMVRLYELVQRLAASDLPVLIHGETGTGKELVAFALHHQSRRAKQKMLAINCAALQESLLESELFGHDRGAFTGAVATKLGLLEAAAGGTVFLDEVAEMSAGLQVKLLRAVETRRITRVGETHEREVDFRVVASTHKDLVAQVKAGRFREDLYFRLAGATLWLPPLRDRGRELPLLARRFLDDACAEMGRGTAVLAPETLQLLASHSWPGNVRELRNVMQFAAAMVTEDIIDPWHLRERIAGQAPVVRPDPEQPAKTPRPFLPIGDEVQDLEQRRMLEALESTGWNRTQAAAAIQMPLRTFVTRFKQFDLANRRR